MPTELIAATPAWPRRRAMLRIVRGMAAQGYVIALCKKSQIAVDTWVAIISNDVLDADLATGRDMRTSQVVAAARVGRSERTVRRARAIAVRLGIMVELYRGRELSRHERLELIKERPGHQQRGIPNTYAMTVCPPRARCRILIPRPGKYAQVNTQIMSYGHLTPVGGIAGNTHLIGLLPSPAADADQTAAASPPQPGRRRRPGIGLAIGIATHPRMALLLDGARPGTLAGQLAAHEHGGWRAHQLVDALLWEASQRHIDTWTPARSPWALLKTLLAAIDPVAEVHLHIGVRATPTAAPEPCGHPDCDHGWITTTDARGYLAARPCRDCPPAIRGAHDDLPF